MVRPDVVLYEESLDERVLSGAIEAISNADVLIVAGTSLSVYPAAGLLHYFNGRELALINKSRTDYDPLATLVVNSDVAQVCKELKKAL